MDYLNIFTTYKNKPLNHEDQLTRAFLILVKTVKLVEVLFLDIIREQMKLNNIDNRPSSILNDSGGIMLIETQVSSNTKKKLEDESGRLVSIIITDERLLKEHKVKRNKRNAVYDGFVKYASDWIFIIENKPDHRNIWIEQLSSNFNENYEIEETPIVITWKNIIKRLSLLIENELLRNSDLNIVGDFLDYVSDFFPELNPYDRFELCKNNEYLLNKHCIEIMKQTKLGSVDYHRGWHHYIELNDKPGIKMVALYPEVKSEENWVINLEFDPGDTMVQSRKFYKNLDIERLVNLREDGWCIKPNLHFSYRSSNLVWTQVEIILKEYLEYWKSIVLKDNLKQVEREDWHKYFSELNEKGMLNEHDLKKINDKIITTNMNVIYVCPGIELDYVWEKNEAILMDNRDQFKNEIVSKIETALDIW